MKKKFLAMLMASVMVLGLAACGGSMEVFLQRLEPEG